MDLGTKKEMIMKIELDTNKNGAWFWKLVGDNGEIMAVSESYSSKGNCNKTVKSVAKDLGFVLNKKSQVWELPDDTVG